MKKLYLTFDKETKFYDDEIEKARLYFDVEGETLEEIAANWNAEHAGDAAGELIVAEI